MSQESVEEPQDTRDYEAEARTNGWRPSEEWKGDPKRWVDAKTFVQRGEEFFPFVQAKLKKEISSLKSELDEVKTVSQQFREFSEKAIERERKDKERLLAELDEARAKAISEGDGTKAVQIEKQIRTVEQEKPKHAERGEPPEVTAWKTANLWYGSDPELTAVADGLSDVVAKENPGLKGKAFLDKLTERVQGVVPHKFQNSRRETPLTEDHQRKTPSKKSKTYEDLPTEAKGHCERFMKTIPGFTKEAFLSQYDWSQDNG